MFDRREKAEALKSARRASARAAAVVHGELKRGLGNLATIASTAPWIGLFGTILGIYNSFPGCAGPKSWCMAMTAELLSQAFVPCAIGLAVALVAMWCYKYLITEVKTFDSEMEGAALQLINDLGRLG